MNERIQELAEQAVNSISDHIDFDIPDVFKEKFAELIVRETLRVTGATPSMAETAKKHFGVEQ